MAPPKMIKIVVLPPFDFTISPLLLLVFSIHKIFEAFEGSEQSMPSCEDGIIMSNSAELWSSLIVSLNQMLISSQVGHLLL